MNTLKHGLSSSRDMVIWDEDPLAFERLRAELEEVYPPVNAVVHELVDDLAGLFWRRRRIRRLEAAALDSDMKGTLNYFLQMADPKTRMRVFKRLGQLQRARDQRESEFVEERFEIAFLADFAEAIAREMPEIVPPLIEWMKKAPNTEDALAKFARHEASLRNGIFRTLTLLHALYAARAMQQ